MDSRTQKDAIRRLALMRRGKVPLAMRDMAAAAITDTVCALPEVMAAPSILAFVSIRSEVPTNHLIQTILASGKQLFLPYVDSSGTMRATSVSSVEDLAAGYRDIPEPRTRAAVPIDIASVGIAIVPGVAFDARGRRLGYGGGYYDTVLAAAPALFRVGICFEVQVVDEIPMEEHDERIDVLVTETRVIRCPRLAE